MDILLIVILKITFVNVGQKIQCAPFLVEYVHVNHSIPDASSLFIKTGKGNVFHTGDFKVDKDGIIHASIGKVSFDSKKIEENASKLIDSIIKLKPSSTKGSYFKSISISSTMSSSIKVDKTSIADL